MASRKPKGQAKAPEQEPRSKDIATHEGSLAAHFDLTTLMTEEAVSLLSPAGASNPGYVACATGLLALLIYGFVTGDDAQPSIMIIGVIVCIVLLFTAQRYPETRRDKLIKQGLNAHVLDDEQREMAFELTDDSLSYRKGANGDVVTRPLTSIRKVLHSDAMILVRFDDGSMVLIPRKALSHQRFLQCLETLQNATGKARKQ